jgi:uncharacterized protein (TIRG00374 family)
MEKKGRARLYVSVALSVALLALFLWKANLREVAGRISRLRPVDFGLSIAASLSTIVIRSARWKTMLRPVARIRFGSAFSATAIGLAASTILPARAGEVVRPVVLSRRTPVPLSASLASVLFERVIDLTTVLVFFLYYCVWPGVRPEFSGGAAVLFRSLRAFALAFGAGSIAFFALAIFATGRRDLAQRLENWLVARLPHRFRRRAENTLSSFLDGLSSVRSPRILLEITGLSLLLWTAICAQIYFLFRAFELPLSPAASILVLVITLIGLAIPTPGGVGGFHKLCQVALTLFYGVDVNSATGLAIVYWFVAFVPVTAIGFALFAAGPKGPREGLTDLAQPVTEE